VTVARTAAVGALALAVALAVWLLLFRGNGGTEYTLVFQNAGQLVTDDDVQVGGRRVGSVREIELTDDNMAAVKVVVEEPYAPLREGTEAVIRLTSLSGIANRYIALTPAPGDAEELSEGATITTESTTDVVDLDQIFNALDEQTRGDLSDVIKGFATQYEGKGTQAGESTKYFNPLLSSSRRLVQQVTEDEAALTEFLVNSSRAVTTIAERRDELSQLVGNANETAAAIGAENAALARALGLLPTTLRRANTTFVNLRATLDDLDVLVAESKPATKDLAPFLRELRPLVAAARPTIRDLRTAVRRPGADNDLVEATRKMPALQRAATPAFRSGRQALEKAQPVLEFARPYTPDLVGWFRDFGQGASNYDANGHFARIQPMFNAFSFADNPAGGLLTPIPPEDRLDGLETGVLRRCPGAATQRPADGSAPFTDGGGLDCDPSLVLPGP
jgi:phospholipid/cholesterol/gamma-HCH transport system substrate-binding protein